MAIAGSLIYDTKINKEGFEKGYKSLKDISSEASKAIKTAIGTVTTAIIGIGTYSIKVGSDFEAGMSKVQAISGATREEIEKLTEKAKEMGQKTKFSATESAEAFQYMAMAGWKTEDMLDGIEGIMDLAAASGENLASVSDIVTDALTAFGLQAKDSAHFADVLAKASSNSNTNVGLMGATFKYVAPIAGSMKYSIEDTAVAIGLMANAGIKGEQAGTALRSMLTRLVKPPKEAAEALKKLNVSAKNSDGTMKPLSQTLKELRSKFAKLNDSQKASYASSIAGTEAMSGMLAIVNASDSDFDKLTKSINNSNGASKKMASTMNGNVKGAFTLLKSNIESVGIKLYDKIKEPLKDIINTISKFVSQIPSLSKNVYDWINKHKEVIVSLIGVVASLTAGYLAYKAVLVAIEAIQIAKNILGTVSAFISLIPTIKSAKDAMLLLNMAFNANPIALIIASVVALTGAFVALQVAEFNERTSLNGLKEEVENQKKSWESLAEAREKSLSDSMSQISICEKLKNELEKITDENGKVKDGYKQRAEVIINTLNGALGTEYKLNGNIIEQYKELKNNIDNVIATKKAEAVLNAYQQEYGTAIKEQSNAVKTLLDLKEQQIEASEKLATGNFRERLEAQQTLSVIGSKMKEQTELIGSYGKTIQDYEALQKASSEGSKEAITKAVEEIGVSYEESKTKVNESLIEQINTQQKYVDAIKTSLEEAKRNKKVYQQKILESQLSSNEQQLDNLKNSLKQQTNTIQKLTPEQIEAWKEIAKRSTVEYSQLLANVSEDTQKEIEKATGIVGQDVGLYRAMRR